MTFCGAAKKRYSSIIQSYKVFKEAGLRCDFMVSRLLPGQNKIAGIDYIKYLISYKDYLRHVMRSDFILEIMQGNATGYTLRTWEAILYDKVLLTDNKAILKAPFYNKDQFIYFEKPEDIDVRRAREQKERAEEQLRQKQSIQQYYHTQASLARAMNRLRLSQDKKWNL